MGYPEEDRPDLAGQLWKHRLYRLANRWEITPSTGAFLYLVFGFTALYLSDVIFVRYISEPVLSQVQALKGGVEVVLTGGLVFVLLQASRYPLEHSNENLERRQEELQVLHRVLRHNLRNDINTIMGFADTVRQTAPPETRDDCAKILQAASNILEYTHQASRIRRVTEKNGAITTYDLTEDIPALVDRHDLMDERIDLSMQIPDRAVVDVNHMFGSAIEELITNAITHAETEHPTISISVRNDSEVRGMTEVCVADDGPGVPEYVVELLGRPEEDQVNHLDGMGLWFVYWTVTESNGTLEIEDADLGGSRVRMWVPQKMSHPVKPD